MYEMGNITVVAEMQNKMIINRFNIFPIFFCCCFYFWVQIFGSVCSFYDILSHLAFKLVNSIYISSLIVNIEHVVTSTLNTYMYASTNRKQTKIHRENDA